MSLLERLSAASVPKSLRGRTLVIGDKHSLLRAKAFFAPLSEKVGDLGLACVDLADGESLDSDLPYVALPTAYEADKKRLAKLKPEKVIIIGAAAQRFELIKQLDAKKTWINAQDSEAAHCGCSQVCVSSDSLQQQIPGAIVTGDPLLLLDSVELPAASQENPQCERFKEFYDRQQVIYYAAATGEDEESTAYGLLFELLRKKTAIMILAPQDSARHEPVYRDAIKYSLPTIRHNRLMTSYIPKKNRVYYVEDPETLAAMYACAQFVIPGGTLNANSRVTPDLLSPISQGKPVIVGPHQEHSLVRAALEAGVVLGGDSVESIGEQALKLVQAPELAQNLAEQARIWLEKQPGAAERVLGMMG